MLVRSLTTLCVVVLLAGCPTPTVPDAGEPYVDAAVPVPCDSPEDCRVAGFNGVCRQGFCAAQVPCADDLECGRAETCQSGVCAFSGCIADADCPTGHCRAETFDCAECGTNADCPFSRPVCQNDSKTCVSCIDDSQCPEPGPGHCEAASGACVHCLVDEHCPIGLTCSAGVCTGAGLNAACPMGTACAAGLTCVTVSSQNRCLPSCNMYTPNCSQGEICYALRFTDSTSLVFDDGAPLGVCFASQAGAATYRSVCTRANGTSNCQPNLQCVAATAGESRCRTYCDPGAAVNPCPTPEICHPFSGDYSGRRYGLCYDDNGYGTECVTDSMCRVGQSCVPFDDPGSFDLLSGVCQFNVGTGKAMAPCSPQRKPDGGVIAADQTCASGACVGDNPLTGDFYCYSSCTLDTDCATDAGTRGYCDTDFAFPTAGGFDSYIRGCRPSCASDSTCAAYGAALTDGGTYACKPVLSTGSTAQLKQACGVGPGVLGAGAACTFGGQCRSGLCGIEDSRGVRRNGYCLEACTASAQCTGSADGGAVSGALDCQPTALLGYRGNDGVIGTGDDRIVTGSLCSGVTCASNLDCLGGAVCVPEASAANPSTLVLACRPTVPGGLATAAPCSTDQQCSSGLCAAADGSDAGLQKVCFEACDGSTTCPAGTTCRAAVRVGAPGGTVTFSGCVP